MDDDKKQRIKDIAQDVSDRLVEESQTDYPDCYECSAKIKERLKNELDIPSNHLEIEEFILEGGYRHYALSITKPDHRESIIIDGSFNQFGPSNQNSPTVSDEEPDRVMVVKPKGRYVFSH